MSASQHIVMDHFTTILLVILCGIKLHSLKKARDVELRYFWLTLISCFLLAVQDALESFAALDPDLLFWRILFSVAGYVLRPVAAVGLLLVVLPPEHRTWKIWIPALLNTAVNLTAFFSPLAFGFNRDYEFVRGPLGFVVFLVSFLYLFMILAVILRRFYEGKKTERWLLVCCMLGVIAAALVDTLLAGRHLNEAIMIGCLFILFYLRSHDNYLDPLTSLRNRFAYYDDSENLVRNISAVASVDMNGLKNLNDSRGHAAGDAALSSIGQVLCGISSRRTLAYRVGGDEFILLFINQAAEDVERILDRVREEVSRAGYSISAGYAMKAPDQSLDDVLHSADRNMYKEKEEYYQHSGRELRTAPDA